MRYSRNQNTAFVLFVLALVSYLIFYKVNAFIAAHISPKLYGDFSLSWRVLSMAASITLLGTDINLQRFLPVYLHEHHDYDVENYIRWNLHFIIKPLLTCLALSVIVLLVGMVLHITNIKAINSYHLVVYLLWATPFAALVLLLANYMLANNNAFSCYNFNNTVKNLVLGAVFFTAFTCFKIPFTAATIGWLIFVTFIILLILEILLIKAKIPFLAKIPLKTLIKKPLDITDQWVKTTWPLLIGNLVFLTYNTTDLLIIKLLCRDEHQVAFYSTALAITGIIWILPTAILSFVKPQISHIMQDHDKLALQQLMNSAILINLVATLSLYGLIVYFLDPLLLHFGKVYLLARPLVLVLLPGTVCASLTKPAVSLLIYTGHEKLLMMISVYSLVGMILLASLLTYCYGALGTAIAVDILLIIRGIVLIRLAKIKTEINSVIAF